MASLWVTEYKRVGSGDFGGGIQAGLEPATTTQKVTISGTSAQSSAFDQETRLIMVHTDTACHVEISDNPTASTSTRRLPADSTVFYAIPNAVTYKIAVIAE